MLNSIKEPRNKSKNKNNATSNETAAKSGNLTRSSTYCIRISRIVSNNATSASRTTPTSASTTDLHAFTNNINTNEHDLTLRVVETTGMHRASSISAAGLNKNLTPLSNKLLSSNSVVIANATEQHKQQLQPQYWEGPPAHFMLPTHAISCRSSRSTDRCPKACKGKISSSTPPPLPPHRSLKNPPKHTNVKSRNLI